MMGIEVDWPLPWLAVRQLHGTKWWFVMEGYHLTVFLDGKPYVFFIPAGYRYDRATIWWQGVIAKDHLGCIAPLIHDVLCTHKGKLPDVAIAAESIDTPHVTPYRLFTRVEADEIFERVMISDKVAKWRVAIARFFIRLGPNW